MNDNTMATINLKNATNAAGASTYDPLDTSTLYAEDWDMLRETLGSAGSSINVLSLLVNSVPVIDSSLNGSFVGSIIAGSYYGYGGTLGGITANTLPQGVLPYGSLVNALPQGAIPYGSMTASLPQGVLPTGSIPSLTSLYIPQGQLINGSMPNNISISGSLVGSNLVVNNIIGSETTINFVGSDGTLLMTLDSNGNLGIKGMVYTL